MKAPTRRERILDGLRTAGKVQVAALASELGTSAVTIRRDLVYLATAGDLRRIHGGAVSIMMLGEAHPGAKRGITSAGSEDRLAAAVAALVADGDVIALASGTLCAPVAKAFFGRRLTVMPFSLQATMELIGQPGINLIAPGGSVHPATGAIIGPLAEASARLFRFDTVVLSLGDAMAADGATAYGTQSASLKRTLLTMARKALIVAAGSMLSPSALATVHPRPSLDVVITDSTAPVPVVDQLRAEGVEVIVL